MKYILHIIAAAVIAALPFSAMAQNESGLPDEASVQTALGNHPSVAAARARVEAAKAEARALGAGPHEVTLSGSYSRRDVDFAGGSNEFDATVMRPFRLPGKKKLDREAGKYGIIAAENRAEDAKHQAAILFANLWWEWLGAGEEARIDAQAVKNYAAMLKSIRRRVQLRDAAQLEADQAEAALGSSHLMAERSKGRVHFARARLAAQFPSFAISVHPPEMPVPTIPEHGFLALRNMVIAQSHEIAAANAEAARVRTLAERTRKNRVADPSLGFRLFSERDGMEKGAGIIASIPLGGGHRRALSDKAASEALAVQAEAVAVRFDVQEMADTDLAAAQATWRAWERSREGMNAQISALMKMRRGYNLNEFNLSDLLLAERMAHDAFRAESQARKDALYAITKIRIDSHNLWIGDKQHKSD